MAHKIVRPRCGIHLLWFLRHRTISALANTVRVHMPTGKAAGVQIQCTECVDDPGGALSGHFDCRVAVRDIHDADGQVCGGRRHAVVRCEHEPFIGAEPKRRAGRRQPPPRDTRWLAMLTPSAAPSSAASAGAARDAELRHRWHGGDLHPRLNPRMICGPSAIVMERAINHAAERLPCHRTPVR